MGGNVVFIADQSLNTLYHFRGEKSLHAKDGRPGSRNHRKGADGDDLLLNVPAGTILYDEEGGRLIVDLAEDGQSVIVAGGGRGGRGNARFATPSRRAPRVRERGEPGDVVRVRLEMKVLADVGLVGLPNAGKSSLLSQISHARPKVGAYPFTTLTPVLGVVETEREGFVVAELPGLVEGASQGAGLGHAFLRHVGRAKILLYVVDATSDDARRDFLTVRKEIEAYSPQLARLEQIVALNKIDLISDKHLLQEQGSSLEAQGARVFAVSALTGENVGELVRALDELVQGSARARGKGRTTAGKPAVYRKPPVPLTVESCSAGTDDREEKPAFRVGGTVVERWAAMADLETPEGVAYLHRRLSAAGVVRRLEELGAKEGDTVAIGATEFIYSPWALPGGQSKAGRRKRGGAGR